MKTLTSVKLHALLLALLFTAACPIFASEVIDFEALPPGTVVTQVNAASGLGPIYVQGTNPDFAAGTEAALIFDSANPTGGDDDLGTPNEDFGGPGIGPGGEAGQPFENSDMLYHVLIVAENLDDAGGDGLVDEPDDAAVDGSQLVFDFVEIGPVTMLGITLLDVEGNTITLNNQPVEQPAEITFYDMNLTQIGSTMVLPQTGSNGLAAVVFDPPIQDVVLVMVDLKGSGAIDNLLFETQPLGCRVTGGGVDHFGQWNGRLAKSQSKNENGTNRYTFGGQAGAPTASQPQPFGEWTHHQQKGPDGSFVFHAGTASAPEGTEIDYVSCSDPGYCVQARPAPAKQIDFQGVGTFKNMKKPSDPLKDVVPGETFHWFAVHIEDLGEPGKGGKQDPPTEACPPWGSAGELADCDCPDFYWITIHADANPASAIIYEVYGYLNGGNLQIHPPIK